MLICFIEILISNKHTIFNTIMKSFLHLIFHIHYVYCIQKPFVCSSGRFKSNLFFVQQVTEALVWNQLNICILITSRFFSPTGILWPISICSMLDLYSESLISISYTRRPWLAIKVTPSKQCTYQHRHIQVYRWWVWIHGHAQLHIVK